MADQQSARRTTGAPPAERAVTARAPERVRPATHPTGTPRVAADIQTTSGVPAVAVPATVPAANEVTQVLTAPADAEVTQVLAAPPVVPGTARPRLRPASMPPAETDPTAAPGTPAVAERPRLDTRFGFAAVALVAALVGRAALAVPEGHLRLVLLMAFMLVGPGAAVLSLVRTADRFVSWALTLTASLTIACGTAVVTLWTHTWRPDLAVGALVAAVATASIVAMTVLARSAGVRLRDIPRAMTVARSGGTVARSLLAAESDLCRSPRQRRSATVIPVVSLVAAVGLWAVALLEADPAAVGGYGLTAAMGVPFVVAVVLVGIGFSVELFGRARGPVLAGGLLVVALLMHATVPLLHGTVEYAWTYKHLGVVDLIRDNGHLLSSTDIYQQWPGFFATMAMLSAVSGVDALSFAAWSALTFAVLNMVLMAAVLRQFTRSRRVVALGVLLFAICMWVDIGYFSPQAFGYTLMLGFWLIVIRWLLVAPAPLGAGAGRIARARALLVRGFPARPQYSRATRVRAAVAATAVFAAITVSHQLTPFLMLVPVVVLAVLGVLRPRLFVIALGLVVAGFVGPRLAPVIEQYNLFDLDVVANAGGNSSGWRTREQEFSALVARGLALTVWGLALLSVLRFRRRLGAVAVPAVIAFAPFVTLAAGNYGGEAIYRVFAFSLAFAALLIAGLWMRMRGGAPTALASGVVLAAMLLQALQGLQGQLVVHQVSGSDIAAARYFYANAQPHSSLVLVAPAFPTKLAANYGSFNEGRVSVDITLIGEPSFIGRLNGSRLPEVENYLRNLGTRVNYLVVNTQMSAYTDYFGVLPRGSIPSLRAAIEASPNWSTFYRRPGVAIYELNPAR